MAGRVILAQAWRLFLLRTLYIGRLSAWPVAGLAAIGVSSVLFTTVPGSMRGPSSHVVLRISWLACRPIFVSFTVPLVFIVQILPLLSSGHKHYQWSAVELVVRCDGKPDGCQNCDRLDFICSFTCQPGLEGDGLSPEGPDQSQDPGILNLLHTQGGTERKRSPRACQECHARKARCSGEMPSCRRCRQRGYQCNYVPSKRTASRLKRVAQKGHSERLGLPITPSSNAATVLQGAASGTALTAAAAADQQPVRAKSPTSVDRWIESSESLVKECIDAYFQHVYPIPGYGFIHRAMLLQDWTRGTLDSCLLKAICGIAARFVSNKVGQPAQLPDWMNQVETEILQDLDSFSVARVQALLLVGLDRYACRKFGAASNLFAVATRMAFALRLNYEDTRLTFIAHECRRRLMWCLYIVDKFLAGGIQEFVLCPIEAIHVRLPCDEQSFEFDEDVKTCSFSRSPQQKPLNNLGIAAHLIAVLDVRDRILRYTKRFVAQPSSYPDFTTDIKGFEKELHFLRSSLPNSLTFNLRNTQLRAFSSQHTSFVMLHVWWHQCHCDLYGIAMPGFREGLEEDAQHTMSPEYTSYCQRQCLYHSIEVGNIVSMAHDHAPSRISDPGLAVCVYHCSRIICTACICGISNTIINTATAFAHLQAFSNAVEELSAIYPFAALLGNFIRELIKTMTRTDDERSLCDVGIVDSTPQSDSAQSTPCTGPPEKTAQQVYSEGTYLEKLNCAAENELQQYKRREGPKQAAATELRDDLRGHGQPFHPPSSDVLHAEMPWSFHSTDPTDDYYATMYDPIFRADFGWVA